MGICKTLTMWLFMKYFKKIDKKPASSFSVWQIHHYYTGYLAFILFGWLSFYALFYWAMWLTYLFAFGCLISLWVIVDDWIQHFIQRKEMEFTMTDYYPGHYETVSFWHWWPYWLGRKLGLKI